MAPEKMVNGVNVDQLFANINRFKEKPELAAYKFRATNTWIDGPTTGPRSAIFTGPARKKPPGNPRFTNRMNRGPSWGRTWGPIRWSISWWPYRAA